jgi:choline dehydrogenase-like flavoprotein
LRDTVDQHADVLIVGAGASGGIAARRLAEAGLRVVALEQGRWHDRDEFRGNQPDWELTGLKQWSPMPAVRRGIDDYPIDVTESDMDVMNFNGVGGGTILYNAIWMRLQASAFRTRTLHGFGDDWPIGYDELLPYYERTDRQIGVSGLGGNPAFPEGDEPPLPPLPIGRAGLLVARTLAKRGWHWWPETNAILSAPYDGRRACVQRGTCGQGCNEGAKSTIDQTHWRRVVELGGRVITGARVSRIVLDEHGLAAGAEWIDDDGTVHFQSGDVVLMAANGIGTARLLLMSAESRFPDGLANRSGLVGRRLMLHPLAMVNGYFHEPLNSWQGQFGSALQCMEFLETDPARGYLGAAKWALHPAGGPMMEAFAGLLTGGGGSGFHARMADRFGHGARWALMCEDLPRDDNRVVLSRELADSAGLAAPKLLYRYDEDARRNLDFNVTQASEVFRDAGAWHVEATNPAGYNAHFLGTARMGDEPGASVVNRWCMSHDIANLGIIDGSVFVTAGAVNPTSTICALALRAAEHLLKTRAEIPVPARRSVHAVTAPSRTPTATPATVVGPLSIEKRARLATLADELIPPADDMPAASQVGICEALLDQVLLLRPDLAEPLSRALDTEVGDPPARLMTLATTDWPAYQALVEVISGGYYLHPRVRKLIGYPGQEARPVQPDHYPAYVEEGLLDHLVSGTWASERNRK